MTVLRYCFYSFFYGFLLLGLAACGLRGSPLASSGVNLPPITLPAQALLAQAWPQKVALLLPLSGSFAGGSDAIRNGFFSAYYYAKQSGAEVPQIMVINTKQGIASAYQQALQQGADFIVGPLTKANVAKLLSIGSDKAPVLALNTLDDYAWHHADWLYQFGLRPEDDAIQIADRMRASNLAATLIIAPETSWGKKIVQAFSQRFQQLGGRVVTQLDYNSRTNFTQAIAQLLDFKPKKKDPLTNEEIAASRREDFDSVFMIAFPTQARQIKPLLNFYYAGDVPVYALAQVYNGYPNAMANRDVDQVQFAGMPWLINGATNPSVMFSALRQRIISLWPHAFRRYPRFFALGIDAYLLVSHLYQRNAGHSAIQGATGTLYVDRYGHVVRKLSWAQFQQGKVVADSASRMTGEN